MLAQEAHGLEPLVAGACWERPHCTQEDLLLGGNCGTGASRVSGCMGGVSCGAGRRWQSTMARIEAQGRANGLMPTCVQRVLHILLHLGRVCRQEGTEAARVRRHRAAGGGGH